MSFRPRPDADRALRQLERHRTGTPSTPPTGPPTLGEALAAMRCGLEVASKQITDGLRAWSELAARQSVVTARI